MRTPILSFALALGGCLTPVGTAEELAAAADGHLGSRFVAALDPANALYDESVHGGPFPYYTTEYLEEGETIPEGFEIAEAWGRRTIARSPDGRELYVGWDGVPTERYLVMGELPGAASVHVVLDADTYEGVQLALVDEAGATAGMLSWSSYAEPLALPLARGPDGAVGAPGLDETVALRWLRTCPGLLEECVLYGSPADVEAAIDPIAPEGDWFLHPRSATLVPPEGARFEEVVRYDGDGGGRLIVTSAEAGMGPDETPQRFHRAWLELQGRRVHAFDFIADDYLEWAVARVARDGDRLIVSHWWPEDVSASFSVHDARTGERIGEPITLEGEMYFEPECSAGISSTRPMPVRVGDELAFALWWGERQVLLFDGKSSYGHTATVDADDDADHWHDTQASDVPAVLHLAR